PQALRHPGGDRVEQVPDGRQVGAGPAGAIHELSRRGVALRVESGVARDLGLEPPRSRDDIHADLDGALAGAGESGNPAGKRPVDHVGTVPGYANSLAGTNARMDGETRPVD